jgi:hypothetical protein
MKNDGARFIKGKETLNIDGLKDFSNREFFGLLRFSNHGSRKQKDN